MSKNFLLLVGPSGSGKTTVAEYLVEHYGMKQVQSYCTRKPRYEGESGHVFVSDEEFDQLENFVGYTEFDGHRYCATAAQVEDCDIYVIDPDGVEYFADSYKGGKHIVVVCFDVYECERIRRMRHRGDTDDAIAKRLQNDVIKFDHYIERCRSLFPTWVVGDGDIEMTAAQVADLMSKDFPKKDTFSVDETLSKLTESQKAEMLQKLCANSFGIRVSNPRPNQFDIDVPINDKLSLVAWNSQSDDNTQQVGLCMKLNGVLIDLACAEVKKGELAKIHGLSADNEDVDLYIWGDPHNEDYTKNIHIKTKDLEVY